jgi:hypothetical protein
LKSPDSHPQPKVPGFPPPPFLCQNSRGFVAESQRTRPRWIGEFPTPARRGTDTGREPKATDCTCVGSAPHRALGSTRRALPVSLWLHREGRPCAVPYAGRWLAIDQLLGDMAPASQRRTASIGRLAFFYNNTVVSLSLFLFPHSTRLCMTLTDLLAG